MRKKCKNKILDKELLPRMFEHYNDRDRALQGVPLFMKMPNMAMAEEI